MAASPQAGKSPRDRFRAQVRDEVKQAALEQLAHGGPQALSLNAIAKSLGLTGPALYRYFSSRDALLTELVVDAYTDLAGALAAAVEAGPAEPLTALVRAYRAWAVAEPHRYRLLFRAPLPDYDPQSADLVEAAQPAMNILITVVSALATDGTAHDDPSAADFARWAGQRGLTGVPAVAARESTLLWSELHGLAGLEIEQNFASMGIDPGPLYEAQAARALRALRGTAERGAS
ncbi:TetR/AcrR family transcriptional regulator [Streptomyces sp. NBC_01476]|uniref:TetR/AcrR family transcriptional regulator n=1 Tax=Streptomyces sp. NBC_01476 TaxID=2903881 RepID=UPI002E32D178|nr:TetR/AcrR family transcriptional regulator [Streptomyces sp. NBC_01476]